MPWSLERNPDREVSLMEINDLTTAEFYLKLITPQAQFVGFYMTSVKQRRCFSLFSLFINHFKMSSESTRVRSCVVT